MKDMEPKSIKANDAEPKSMESADAEPKSMDSNDAESETERSSAKKEEQKEEPMSKKQQKNQLRREIRQKKKDMFRIEGPLGKIFWVLRRFVRVMFLLAVIFTVVTVNVEWITHFASIMLGDNSDSELDLSQIPQEEVDAVMPTDEEGAARIALLPENGKDETWAVYIYMVGSDLESKTEGQLSQATDFYVGMEAEQIVAKQSAEERGMMETFMKDVQANGMDLPNFFYNKVTPSASDAANSTGEDETEVYDYHAASMDIQEILSVTLPENVKVVLQPGGAGNWAYGKINPNRTQRLLYDSQGMRVVSDEHISNMGDGAALSDFLRYCKEEHPADHTMIVFWNHGGGAFGYGIDALYGKDRLTLTEMKEAFASVYTADEENPPIDLIGFDACLMSSMEVANTFHGFASYLVGSEELEPGNGWDYAAWLGKLAENPQMNGAQIGKAVADSYVEYYNRVAIASGTSSNELFSVIDLRYADDLYDAYDAFAAQALRQTAEYPGTAARLGQVANRSIKYAGAYHTIYNTLDLGVFMDESMKHFPEEAKDVRDLVDKAVLYNLANAPIKESTGITVYYPSTIRDMDGLKNCIKYVDTISESKNISALYYYKVAGCLREDLQAYVQEQGYGEIQPMNTAALKAMKKAEITLLEDGNYIAQTGESVLANAQTIGYHLFRIKDGTAQSLGRSSFIELTEKEDLKTAYDCTWVCINGQPFPLEILSSTDNVVSFISDIELETEDEIYDAYLFINYDFDTQKWSIMGIQKKAIEDRYPEIAARDMKSLKLGDIITPVYETYDLEMGQVSMVSGEEIRYDDDIKIEEATLEDGEYVSYISITDARGDLYQVPEVSFEIKDGRIQNAKQEHMEFLG